MKDKNGKELTTGQIVEIRNAYFKSDNGLFFVEKSPGDPWYIGSDITLKRINRNGKLSKTNPIQFWPICIFVSDHKKRYEGNSWNKQHATIEIVDANTKYVSEYFNELSCSNIESASHNKLYGHSQKEIDKYIEAA